MADIDEYIKSLESSFPNTTILNPGCGSETAYLVCSIFRKKAPPLDQITLSLDQTQDNMEVSLSSIQTFLQEQGLYCYPLKATFGQLNLTFDRLVCVVHTRSKVNSPRKDEAGGHFSLLLKRNNEFSIVEPTQGIVAHHAADANLKSFESETGYTGSVLVVSDQPLDFKQTYASGVTNNIVPWAVITLSLSIIAFILLRVLHKFMNQIRSRHA